MTPKGRAERTAAALRTTLYGRNHIAGTGVSEDCYDDESMGCPCKVYYRKSFDKQEPQSGKEWEKLNGPVVIIQPAKAKQEDLENVK